ncbi:protein phosphatase 2C domain-containing protein [Sphaerisporangium fuscum]|uniref:protein phosphatase 2C domain-containing protein n=1 Tax=Sphaerisporangium fuscum TaxID=2835868 RepID=UPI001BDD5D88|nr:protein phosphatase 2C domain-containing protein [Sphaerisporangium fuscum]
MHISYRTVPAPSPGRRNEDFVIAGPDWIAVLDGATAPAGVDSGCRHDVAWFTGRLGAALGRGLTTTPESGLVDVLSEAVREVMAAHQDGCDLTNADSPSSTVAMVRRRAETVDYLVLCDSPVALAFTDGTVTVIDDDRTEHLPGGRPYSLELVRSLRNRPGGFWVASTRPEAACEALAGSVRAEDLRGVLLATDGVTRLVQWYGRTWEQLVETAANEGPGRLIAQVREAESAHGTPGGAKRHDDATAAWVWW